MWRHSGSWLPRTARLAVRLDGDLTELTTLHWAAASGSVEVVRFLLSPSVGADARAGRNNKFTPLHSAAMQGHAVICEELLGAGAQVNVQTDPQGTPRCTARLSPGTSRHSGCCWPTGRTARWSTIAANGPPTRPGGPGRRRQCGCWRLRSGCNCDRRQLTATGREARHA